MDPGLRRQRHVPIGGDPETMTTDNPISSVPGTDGSRATATGATGTAQAGTSAGRPAGASAASLAAAGYTGHAHFSVPDLFPESPIVPGSAHRGGKSTTTTSGSGAVSGASVTSLPAGLYGQGRLTDSPTTADGTDRAGWARRAASAVDSATGTAIAPSVSHSHAAISDDPSASSSDPSDDAGDGAAKPIPVRAADTTPDNPWPVGHVAQVFTGAIERWPALWMIGQIVEINVRRRGSAYITLHDDAQDISMQVVAFGEVAMKAREFKQGDQILVHGRANMWVKQSRFSFKADQIRAVGRGRLIEQINELRMRLKGEGLFDADRKKPLPEFPSTIGIICGPGARAESDIIRNAQLRWPTINFVVEPAAVQGIHCPPEVIAALKKLDARDDIDVIIVARGGGSFEDLIGFSDEGVVRQIAACRHPVVTAIGHEADWTLADQAADLRASTPTDAAKRVVPDVMEQTAIVADQCAQMNSYLDSLLSNEQRLLDGYRTRPVLLEPARLLDEPERVISQAWDRLDTALRLQIDDENLHLEKRVSSLEALSPLKTLRRGYAIVQDGHGTVVMNAADLSKGQALTLRLRSGSAGVTVTRTAPQKTARQKVPQRQG